MKKMAVKRSIYITLIGSFLFAFAIVANGQTKEELEKRRRENPTGNCFITKSAI